MTQVNPRFGARATRAAWMGLAGFELELGIFTDVIFFV
jgi:hypothetical protein